MKSFIIALLATFSLCSSAAEPWRPSKPIELVVPWPAGGAGDTWGRLAGRILADNGIENIVVNKPGADTTIAANYVAKSKPDGLVLLAGGLGALDANLADKNNQPMGIEYTEKSFDDVVLLGRGSFVLAVANNVPVNNYEEFKTYIRKNPEKFSLGTWNRYLAPAFREWARLEKLPMPTIVDYKGTAPIQSDLAGGHLPFAIDTWSVSSQFAEAGKIKIIAIFDNNGYEFAKKTKPAIKVVNISAIHPQISVPLWNGIVAPTGTPKEAIVEINQVINRGLKDPKYIEGVSKLNLQITGGSPEELGRTHGNLLKLLKGIVESK